MAKKVRDLRSALELLAELPGQLLETDVEVEPMAQLSGVYRYVGAGGTVKRPTKEGTSRCQCCHRRAGQQEACGCPFGL